MMMHDHDTHGPSLEGPEQLYSALEDWLVAVCTLGSIMY